MKNNVMQKKDKRFKNNRFLIAFICIFLALVVIFASILGIASAVKKSKSVAIYKGQSMNVEVASFFASYYKYIYMTTLSRSGIQGVEDSPGFWNSTAEDGKTYLELLSQGAEEYLRQIIVGNYLYDRYGKLTSDEKDKISRAVDETVEYKADGDRKKFDTLTEEYGFNYTSFREAVTMLYKASTAQSMIYGADGSNVAYFPDRAAEYLSEYSHVMLLFIRTKDKFVYENGQRVRGEDGNYLLEPLTPEEISDREGVISEIRSAISAIGSGEGVEMNAEMFSHYLQKHDEGDEDMRADGYYFSSRSSYTKEFSTVFKNIVDKSYEMPINSFSEIPLDFGVCFIYKCEPTQGAYASGLSKACFSDFYQDASLFLFEKDLTALSAEVAVSQRFSEINLITLPRNYTFLPSF